MVMMCRWQQHFFNKHQERWHSRYMEFVEYKRLHGTTLVPVQLFGRHIGQVVSQSAYKAAMQTTTTTTTTVHKDNNNKNNSVDDDNNNKPPATFAKKKKGTPPLTAERIQALNDIDFCWTLTSTPQQHGPLCFV
jgi:Helicase associated domain